MLFPAAAVEEQQGLAQLQLSWAGGEGWVDLCPSLSFQEKFSWLSVKMKVEVEGN